MPLLVGTSGWQYKHWDRRFLCLRRAAGWGALRDAGWFAEGATRRRLDPAWVPAAEEVAVG